MESIRESGAGPRSGLALRWLVAAGLILVGCGDAATGPGGRLELVDVSPARLFAGGTVEVRGREVETAAFFLDGRALEVVARMEGAATVRVPAELPPCPEAGPTAVLSAVADGASDSLEVTLLGRPISIDLAPAEHAVVSLGAQGCPVRLRGAGTYGAALFRTASAGQDQGRPVSLRLAVVAAAADPLPVAGPGPASRFLRASAPEGGSDAGPEGAGSAVPDACRREPRDVGDVLVLESPYGTTDGAYRVVSASPHFEVLVEEDSLRTYPTRRRELAEGLAATLETEVHPFLARVFDAWPDLDGDGRLSVLVSRGVGASFSGGVGYYPDGCAGDFVVMAHSLLDADLDAEENSPLEIIVHEAVHWYDLGEGLERIVHVPEWTVEATASLIERMFRWERRGRPFWEPRGLRCPAGANCELMLMVQNRYARGFTREAGYSAGMHLLHWLLQQAVPVGASPHTAAGMLRHRRSTPDDRRLRPVFEAMGGTGRTEGELQGEYLLSFYADEVVPGASPRIQQLSWRLPEISDSYPLRAFTLGPGGGAVDVGLGRPDGVVFEVDASGGDVLVLDSGAAGLGLAVVHAGTSRP